MAALAAMWNRFEATILPLGLGLVATEEERAIRQQMVAALTAVLAMGVTVVERWEAEQP